MGFAENVFFFLHSKENVKSPYSRANVCKDINLIQEEINIT